MDSMRPPESVGSSGLSPWPAPMGVGVAMAKMSSSSAAGAGSSGESGYDLTGSGKMMGMESASGASTSDLLPLRSGSGSSKLPGGRSSRPTSLRSEGDMGSSSHGAASCNYFCF
jgi:hypothetical protein